MDKNRTQFAILGMLSLQPMSGYDFRKTSEQCLGYFWQESYGQIYPTLKKMQEKRYVSRQCQRSKGKPDRYMYSITDKGLKVFRAWLDQGAAVEKKRNEMLLKIFFGGKSDVNKQIRELEILRENNEKLLAELKEIDDWHVRNYDHHALTPYWLITIRFGIRRISALIEWCRESIKILRHLPREVVSSVPDPINFYFKSRRK